MGFTLFISLFLLSLGLGLVIKALLSSHLPLSRWIVGSLIVLLGVHLLMNNLRKSDQLDSHRVWFSDSNLIVDSVGNSDIDVAFGDVLVDLRQFDLNDSLPTIRIQVVFGHAEVLLPQNVAFVVETDMGFAGTTGLTRTAGGFGHHYYASPLFQKDANYLTVDVSVLFGAVAFAE